MAFQIFVKMLRGNTITLDIDSNDTIHDIKQKIHDKDNVPIEHQILTYSGKKLLPHHNISHYGITQDCTLNLSLKLLSASIKLKICQTNIFHTIAITSLTTLGEFKQRCIADQFIRPNTKIVLNDHILTNDNLGMMDIKNWNKETFHTRSSATLDEVKGIIFTIYNYKYNDRIHVSDIQKLHDKKALVSTLIYDYLESIDVHPLFYCGYPHCPFKYVLIRLNGMLCQVGLQCGSFKPFDGRTRDHGTIPARPLNSCFNAVSSCDCDFEKSIDIDAWHNVVHIALELPDISFFFRNYYYIDGKFYKIQFQNDKNTFDLHFCPTFLPKPLKLNEKLLVHGYIRTTFYEYYNITSVDIINLICTFYPELLGCKYEVSKYNERLSDKLEQKTDVFEIDAVQYYLKYVGDYEKSWQSLKGLCLVLKCDDESNSYITFLCQLYCKSTKQQYTCVKQTYLSNKKSKHILLTDFGSESWLESIVCNVTILNRLKLMCLYEYPLQIMQSDYLMEWEINKEILDLMKKAMYGDSTATEFQQFESKIFYELFVLRCCAKKDTLYFGIQLIALPINKRNGDGLLTKCQIYVTEIGGYTDEFTMCFDYTEDSQGINYNFSSMIKTMLQKNTNELTIRAKIEIIEPPSEK